MFSAIRRPLLAIILGLLPLVLFMGVSNTVRVNGELVRDDQLNILGLVLAGAGLWIAMGSLRPGSPHLALRRLTAIMAVLICGAQLAASAGLFSPQRLVASLMPDAGLPPLAYDGLDEANRRIPQGILARNDPVETRRQIVNYLGSVTYNANRHMAYADRCHAGRYRINTARIEALPDFLTDDERRRLTREAAGGRVHIPPECSPSGTRHLMGEQVDTVKRVLDFLDILIAGYRVQMAASAPR